MVLHVRPVLVALEGFAFPQICGGLNLLVTAVVGGGGWSNLRVGKPWQRSEETFISNMRCVTSLVLRLEIF